MRLLHPVLVAVVVLVLAPTAVAQNPFDCAPYPWLDSIQQPLQDPFPAQYRPAGDDGPAVTRALTKPGERGVVHLIRQTRAREAENWRHRLAARPAEDRMATYCPTDVGFTFWDDGEWAADLFTTTASYNDAGWPVVIREEMDWFGQTESMETRFTYQSGRMTAMEVEHEFGDLWREEYSFDSQGRLTEGIGQEYYDGAWYPEFRVTLAYGAGPWVESFVAEGWAGGGWQADYRGWFTYEGQRLTEVLYEAWTGSGWEPDDRETYEYDAAGRVVLAEFEYWQQRILIAYDAQGRMLTWEEQSGYNDWETDTLFEYTYGSHTAPSELVIHYGYFDQPLEPYARLRYSYEGGLFASVEVDYYMGESWEVSDRETLARDNQARPLERISQGYGVGTWHNNTRTTYGFDGPTSTEASPLAIVVDLAVAPNPARASTALLLDLASPADVRIDLFDVLGRRLQRVFSGEMVAGSQRTALDVAPLAPGVYVVRVEAGGHVITRRLTVVR